MLILALSEVAGARGQFRGVRLSEFAYPDFHSPVATLYDYRLPFEDCGKLALGDAVQPRRFVVPGILLVMPDNPKRQQLIQAIAGLYCAAWLDCACSSFRWLAECRDDQTQANDRHYIEHVRHLLTRFDDAVNLLAFRPLSGASVVNISHEIQILAAATAQAMREAFEVLIRPTLWYEKDGLRAVNIRTEFTPEQWQNHLHLACSAALGQALKFPPLPTLQGDAKNGYALRLQDHETAQANVCAAHQNQPGALRRAC
ncbi:MAG: hypothetical protein DCE87_05670 [Betaproteobacteria bacterium]|nr:MAG: hypothetical protein DCE87_05670 [Betaproteobacteria bacterium]PZO25455.1 MAG: hypothetical protein DCE89_03020 [Betaproteobacteria bacterium]PZO26825.1 MAG: hypothetical protein DCE88_11470 [Betaproteobacteria bacterium]